jgi:hypothetical protein
MQRRSPDELASTAEAAADRVTQAANEIGARFGVLAREIVDVRAQVSQTAGDLLVTGQEWMGSEHDGLAGLPHIARLRALRDQLAQAVAAWEPSRATPEAAMKRGFSTLVRSPEPLPPRSGRDYDYFSDLRQLLDGPNTETSGLPPA